jgi:hypothetical protein
MRWKEKNMQPIEEKDEEWSGCCSHTNKHFIKYLTQIGFGATVVIFSMVQIARSDVESKEIYFSMLTGTLGIFMPHPSLKSDK